MNSLSRRSLLRGLTMFLATSPLWFARRRTEASERRGFVMVDGWILRHSDLEHIGIIRRKSLRTQGQRMKEFGRILRKV